ncbi:LysE family translocator [Afifella sp. IM 167]|uniref:LysE family translocator n=1 Tax=Afifella sp. IM 167 TaxID=2033586 RepID=UPI001CCB0A48|nr:LysE family translocator [Afifella sp. IM 167]MBZ8132632.1 transporter [Afifella sp. IM 167]
MIELSTFLTYLAACIAIVIVPGPTVTVIIANSMRHGARAGLLNVAGTQAGLAIMVAILAFGLSAVVVFLGEAFFWLKLAGAAYLIWLGIKLWRSDGTLGSADTARATRNFFLQGFIVIWSNPKALFFFGAFIPQFIDPAGNTVTQMMLLGAIFMAVATFLDSMYALAAGRTGLLLSRRNVRLVELFGGTCLVGGGIWMALSRR